MTIDELKERLTDEFQDIYKCILINGNWGIGKSYFLEKDYLKEKDYVKVSLFGLNDIEEVKSEIYAQLNKFLNFIKNGLINKLSGNNINLLGGIASISIPYFKNNIQSAIKRKCKKGSLIIVFDDLERKSANINMEDILGIIESISTIENINIIIVANEKKITEKQGKTIFENFKEKVIQKVYYVDRYSENAPKEIIKNYLKNLKLLNKRCNLIEKTILEIFNNHPINNLRTLEKACNFVKLILKHIKIETLSDEDIEEIIIISLGVVAEETEKIYTEIERKEKEKQSKEQQERNAFSEAIIEDTEGKLAHCISKNYLKKYFGMGTLINPIISIYRDIDVKLNFEIVNKYYEDLHNLESDTEHKELLYLSEADLINTIREFHNKYILNIDKSLDINNWFKRLNEIYEYSSIVNLQEMFKEDEIYRAMDSYVEDINFKGSLYNIIDSFHMLENHSEKMKEYRQILNSKITEKYYMKLICEISRKIKNNSYEFEKIETLFSLFSNNQIDFNKKKVIDKIIENKYFIPNLNGTITSEQWRWSHKIWKTISSYAEFLKDDKNFEECVKNILKKSSRVGKYRIDFLNKYYEINMGK